MKLSFLIVSLVFSLDVYAFTGRLLTTSKNRTKVCLPAFGATPGTQKSTNYGNTFDACINFTCLSGYTISGSTCVQVPSTIIACGAASNAICAPIAQLNKTFTLYRSDNIYGCGGFGCGYTKTAQGSFTMNTRLSCPNTIFEQRANYFIISVNPGTNEDPGFALTYIYSNSPATPFYELGFFGADPHRRSNFLSEGCTPI